MPTTQTASETKTLPIARRCFAPRHLLGEDRNFVCRRTRARGNVSHVRVAVLETENEAAVIEAAARAVNDPCHGPWEAMHPEDRDLTIQVAKSVLKALGILPRRNSAAKRDSQRRR